MHINHNLFQIDDKDTTVVATDSAATSTYTMETLETLCYPSCLTYDNKFDWVSDTYSDVASGDYHLNPASFGADSGGSVSGFSTDMEGLARNQGERIDMGAYEVEMYEDNDSDDLWDAAESAWGISDYGDDEDIDGLSDGEEVQVYNTSPFEEDSDGDRYNDGEDRKSVV